MTAWPQVWEERSSSHAVPSLETMLTSPQWFGLGAGRGVATPVQRATCRIMQGLPLGDLARDPDVLRAVGDVSRLPQSQPALVLLLAGIRGGKSVIAAACAARAGLVYPVADLMPGETPRIPIVSVHKDQAAPTLAHLAGATSQGATLRARLACEPTADTVTLRHPSGRNVEIVVSAGARAGVSLTARWLPAVIFEEAARMVGADAGVVNLTHMLDAIAGRVGMVGLISSPWAPFGPVYDLVREREGRPSLDVVVIRATGPMMNPVYWTQERMDDLRRRNPLAYRTDVEAQFADPPEALIPSATIDACTRREPMELAPVMGCSYSAAIDPGTRRNAWTLVVATRLAGRTRVAVARQWQGTPGQPLDANAILEEIAALLRLYRCTAVESDQWSGDALAALARHHGLDLTPYPDSKVATTEMYLELGRQMGMQAVELPPDQAVRGDLLRMQRYVTPTGVDVRLPETPDGRHCDYVPALARVVRSYIRDYVEPVESRAQSGGGRRRANAQALGTEEKALVEGLGRDPRTVARGLVGCACGVVGLVVPGRERQALATGRPDPVVHAAAPGAGGQRALDHEDVTPAELTQSCSAVDVASEPALYSAQLSTVPPAALVQLPTNAGTGHPAGSVAWSSGPAAGALDRVQPASRSIRRSVRIASP